MLDLYLIHILCIYQTVKMTVCITNIFNRRPKPPHDVCCLFIAMSKKFHVM